MVTSKSLNLRMNAISCKSESNKIKTVLVTKFNKIPSNSKEVNGENIRSLIESTDKISKLFEDSMNLFEIYTADVVDKLINDYVNSFVDCFNTVYELAMVASNLEEPSLTKSVEHCISSLTSFKDLVNQRVNEIYKSDLISSEGERFYVSMKPNKKESSFGGILKNSKIFG